MHDMMAHLGHGSLLGGLFLVGLVGGLTHCTGMCGPFVLAQTVARLEAIPASAMHEWKRLSGAALFPYHLGRACTYAGLGAAGGALAGSVVTTGMFHWLPPFLLVLAALLLLGAAFPKLFPYRWRQRSEKTKKTGGLISSLFKNPVGWRGWLLGVLLGFLPCGFLYGALSAAAASASAATGAMAMAAFTAGTALPLMATGLIGHVAGSHWRSLAKRCAPWLLSANAVILLLMAWKAAA